MNVEGRYSPSNTKDSRPFSVFVFNAGSCGGCEIEILSLFTHSNQADQSDPSDQSDRLDKLRCEFINQPEAADLIILFGSLNRESSQVFKEFLPRFSPDSRRLLVGACAISGGLYQLADQLTDDDRVNDHNDNNHGDPVSGHDSPASDHDEPSLTAQDSPGQDSSGQDSSGQDSSITPLAPVITQNSPAHDYSARDSFRGDPIQSLRRNLIQEFSPDLYVAGCPPGPEDIWQGIQYLASGTRPPDEAGKMEFRPGLCLGCGLCQKICPGKAIGLRIQEMEGHDAPPSCLVEFNQGACLFCSLCEQLCPTGAIRIFGHSPLLRSKPEEFMVAGSIPLIRCPGCGKWMVAMPDAFYSKLFGSSSQLHAPDSQIPGSSSQLFGSISDRIGQTGQTGQTAWLELCPSCRRSASARHLKTAAEALYHLHETSPYLHSPFHSPSKKGGV
jgi:formate hydrogenlyase subunit 6/NADH:ubiquinone oxidoreductase subunit I